MSAPRKRFPYAHQAASVMGESAQAQENAATAPDSSGIRIEKARAMSASEKANRAAHIRHATDREQREAEERAKSAIRHRAGSLAEVAAITPTHALDLLTAIWRSTPRRCPTCGR